MDVVATTDPQVLARVYREILVPSFPPDELASLDSLHAELATGRLLVVVASRDDALCGVALGEWSPRTGVLLLAQLAVAPGGRGGGVGGTLLHRALDLWRESLDPWLVLAEVEDPARHTGSVAHGDPAARLRFYRRFGARTLPVPYVQPALTPGGSRVRGLLLLALCASGDRLAGVEKDGTWLLPTAPLREFLLEYFTASEGAPPSDDEWSTLTAALAPATLRVP